MARLLGEHYDVDTAAKLIERELRKARRARSRARFAFWAAVANALKPRTTIVVAKTAPVDHQPNVATGQQTSGAALAGQLLEGISK
jgi:hypothetical protein